MQKTMEAKLKIESWDEKPYRELGDGTKFTRADVRLSGPSDGLVSAGFEALMFYRADGSSAYAGLMHITGVLDGHAGSFVLRGDGSYDDATARVRFHVVEGSGTGELAGLTGTGESVSTHDDYPFMPLTLTYEIT
jgi:hypothetical protein